MELQENEENEEDKPFGLVWNFTHASVRFRKCRKCKVMNQVHINYSISPNVRRPFLSSREVYGKRNSENLEN